jgi:hypothetical protein
MQVFLIPLGAGRYEPYTEVGDLPLHDDEGTPARGIFRRFRDRFTEMMQAAERAQRERDLSDGSRSLGGRITDRILAWVAERVAEQRLLWQLRKHDAAVLIHPSNLNGEQAQALLFDLLRKEIDRHRRWLVIDGVLTLITGPLLFFVPGPNIVAYYFAFRAVGHFLSDRGARHGLSVVNWSTSPSQHLLDLVGLGVLDPPVREARIRAVATELKLPHLPVFLERLVLPGA